MKKFLICIISLILVSCASTPDNVKWNDARCVKYSDYYKKMKNENGNDKTMSFIHLLNGDYDNAYKNLTGGGVVWVEGRAGGGEYVLVAYNELGRVVAYKDSYNTELTLADLDYLGEVLTGREGDYDIRMIIEANTKYKIRREALESMLKVNPEYRIQTYRALPMPKDC